MDVPVSRQHDMKPYATGHEVKSQWPGPRSVHSIHEERTPHLLGRKLDGSPEPV